MNGKFMPLWPIIVIFASIVITHTLMSWRLTKKIQRYLDTNNLMFLSDRTINFIERFRFRISSTSLAKVVVASNAVKDLYRYTFCLDLLSTRLWVLKIEKLENDDIE